MKSSTGSNIEKGYIVQPGTAATNDKKKAEMMQTSKKDNVMLICKSICSVNLHEAEGLGKSNKANIIAEKAHHITKSCDSCQGDIYFPVEGSTTGRKPN